MGEMADFLNEQIQSYHEDLEDGLIEEEQEGPFPTTKTCRQCGKGGLHWQFVRKGDSKYEGGWRLFHADGTIHNCSKKTKATIPRI